MFSCVPKESSQPDSSIHGISQARTLEWAAISSSRGSSWPRDKARVSCIGRGILYQLFHLRSRQFTQYRKCFVQGCVSCLHPTDVVSQIPAKAMASFNEFGWGALLRAFKMIFFLMKQMLRILISPQTFFPVFAFSWCVSAISCLLIFRRGFLYSFLK